MKFHPHPYQIRAIGFAERVPRCLLFLDMGLGKSVITLTAVQRLIEHCEASKVLVIAPKKVAESTWSTEAGKWDHLWLRVSSVTGDAKHRRQALGVEAEVYVAGRDSTVWMIEETHGLKGFDMVVIDELTSFKNPSSKRFKALKKYLPSMSRVIGLTGTPTPNGMADLWAQVYCIDNGERLGRYVTRYREKYFDMVIKNNIPIKMWLKPGAEEEIKEKISDITLTMRAEDWLSLPDMIEQDVTVMLPPEVISGYDRFSRIKVADTLRDAGGDPAKVTAANAASLAGKLSQYANGAIYDDDGAVVEIHDEKIQMLDEIMQSTGSPVLVFYQFKHDLSRILAKLGSYKPRVYEGKADLDDWNAGKIRMLLAHPASTAFGLNMQSGGHTIVWFSTGWNLELYQQANARLHRQGQKESVRVFRLISAGTIDERMTAAIAGKDATQGNFLKQLTKQLKEQYGEI